MKEMQSFEEFLIEGKLYEASSDINLNDGFAMVEYGGPVGTSSEYPVLIKGRMGRIIRTGNDKEHLKTIAKERQKNLSPADKKYYKAGYGVIELTAYVKKTIAYLSDQVKSSMNVDDGSID